MPTIEADNKRKLFVGGLSQESTDASLQLYFQSFGKISSAVVLRDSETLSSRGFGFVVFSSSKEALNCLNTENHVIDNKQVEIKWALARTPTNIVSNIQENPTDFVHDEVSPGENAQKQLIESKIFVGGLAYSTVSKTLREYFSKFGDIISTEIIYNKETRISRGFGFVQFKESESVEKVIEYQTNNQPHRIDRKKVEVKRCFSKNENASNKKQSTESKVQESHVEPIRSSSRTNPRRRSSTRVSSFAEAVTIGTKHARDNIKTVVTGEPQKDFDFPGSLERPDLESNEIQDRASNFDQISIVTPSLTGNKGDDFDIFDTFRDVLNLDSGNDTSFEDNFSSYFNDDHSSNWLFRKGPSSNSNSWRENLRNDPKVECENTSKKGIEIETSTPIYFAGDSSSTSHQLNNQPPNFYRSVSDEFEFDYNRKYYSRTPSWK